MLHSLYLKSKDIYKVASFCALQVTSASMASFCRMRLDYTLAPCANRTRPLLTSVSCLFLPARAAPMAAWRPGTAKCRWKWMLLWKRSRQSAADCCWVPQLWLLVPLTAMTSTITVFVIVLYFCTRVRTYLGTDLVDWYSFHIRSTVDRLDVGLFLVNWHWT